MTADVLTERIFYAQRDLERHYPNQSIMIYKVKGRQLTRVLWVGGAHDAVDAMVFSEALKYASELSDEINEDLKYE